jgi:hypothetical protein
MLRGGAANTPIAASRRTCKPIITDEDYPPAFVFLDATLCVSATEIWVESLRGAWREEDRPERFSTARKTLRTLMPIDYMPVREGQLPPLVSRSATEPYQDRLQVRIEAERIHEMLFRAAYDIERTVPDEKLALAERTWFGDERPFCSARQAWKRLDDELEHWEMQLEAERSAAKLYASDDRVTFIVDGIRFRKEGSLGKIRETFSLRFEGNQMNATK